MPMVGHWPLPTGRRPWSFGHYRKTRPEKERENYEYVAVSVSAHTCICLYLPFCICGYL